MKRIAFFFAASVALIAVLIFAVWGVMAIWFRAPVDSPLRIVMSGAFAILALAACIGFFHRRVTRFAWLFMIASVSLIIWWIQLSPPESGNWSPEVSRRTTGEFTGNTLTVYNVRDFHWRGTNNYDQRWKTQSYNLDELSSVDLFLSYWGGPAMAHFVLSFGFADGQYLAWSVEVRREVGSGFSPVADMFKEHTLSIIAAEEVDVIGLRTNIRKEDVHLYRLRFDAEEAHALLRQYVDDANALAKEPRWYNSIFTNCTTVVFHMMRSIGAGRHLDWRMIVNGYLPEYGYERGTVYNRIPMQDLKELSKITGKAQKAGLTEEFSENIRVGVPSF